MTLAHLACAVALLGPPTTPPPSDASDPLGFTSPEARAQFEAAMAAWQADDLEVAQRLLESAHALEPKPALLYALGQIARLRGDCATARAHLRAFLDTDPSPTAAAEARVNLERCAEAPTPDPTPTDAPPEPAVPPPVEPPAPPPRPGPDALGIALTAVGAAVAATGVGVGGSAFAVQDRAERERSVLRFEQGVGQARVRYFTGVGLVAAGSAVLVGGVVRLVIARRRRASGR